MLERETVSLRGASVAAFLRPPVSPDLAIASADSSSDLFPERGDHQTRRIPTWTWSQWPSTAQRI
jgi:hypothetical protein